MADAPATDDDLNRLPTAEDLGRLQFTTILYYLHETNPDNGGARHPHRQARPRHFVPRGGLERRLAAVPRPGCD
jgi:hypothetical protein